MLWVMPEPINGRPSTGGSTHHLGRRTLARHRRELILGELRRNGSVRVTELASELDVSEMTVRRDLDALDTAGLAEKVHGGATLRFRHTTDEPGFDAKITMNAPEKESIARTAALSVDAGSSIGITAGTTTARMAAELSGIADLTVVTNSIRVAQTFATSPRSDRTVILTGGERTPSEALVGPVAVGSLGSFHLDQVFMGVHGMHERAGFTTPNLHEAETNRAFIAAADRVTVLADHAKWGVTGLATITDFEEVDTLVTDAGHAEQTLDFLASRVRDLVVVLTAAEAGGTDVA